MQEYISYKNIQIAFTAEGKGKTIVLLHGFLESSTIWKNVVSAFKETHQIIAIDLLGHGKTEKLGYIHSMETMAETVHAVLSELNDCGIKNSSFLFKKLSVNKPSVSTAGISFKA